MEHHKEGQPQRMSMSLVDSAFAPSSQPLKFRLQSKVTFIRFHDRVPSKRKGKKSTATRQGRVCVQVTLRKLFEKLGPTYIKLGQFIASSPTLFPEEYVLEFSKCLDRAEPVPWTQIQGTLQRELQRPLDEIFASLDPTPLASASIAQVHAGGWPLIYPCE